VSTEENQPVRLDPATEEVRRLTDRAMAASATVKPTLTVRCSQCHTAVGYAAMTSAGALFTSSWEVELPLGFDVIANGEKLNRRQAQRFRNRREVVTARSGPPITETGTDGVVALLALPPGVAEDYPALLVRCKDHGDAVLSRVDVLAAVRDAKPSYRAVLSWPATAYTVPDSTWLTVGKVNRSREARRLS
jgi:hypothetical protein